MKIFVLALLLFSTAANAYTKPPGAPQIAVPDHGVVITIFAAQTPVGHGIGVFEVKPDGALYLCGQCIVTAEYPTMDGPVNDAGGPGPYVASKLPEINRILASRYPQIGAPTTGTTVEKVNGALGSYVLRLVNGSPALGAK